MLSGINKFNYDGPFCKSCYELYLKTGDVLEAAKLAHEQGMVLKRKKTPISPNQLKMCAIRHVLENPVQVRPDLDKERVSQGYKPFTDDEYFVYLVDRAYLQWSMSRPAFDHWFHRMNIPEKYRSLAERKFARAEEKRAAKK